MKLLAEIGVILSIFSKAIFKYLLWPAIVLSLLAFLFPKYFYVYPYVLMARIVGITIISFIMYILIFGFCEITMNKCIQRRIGERRGYKGKNILDFYPIDVDKVIRIKRIGRIRRGLPGTFVRSDFGLMSNMPLTILIVAGIVSISFFLSK